MDVSYIVLMPNIDDIPFYSVHDHIKLKTGHKTRLWCSQDEGHRKSSKPSTKADAKHRDTLGMIRYPCDSKLTVTCKEQRRSNDLLVSVTLKHTSCPEHAPYYDVTLPTEALAIICECVDWATPNEILRRVQATFPQVTSGQVHGAWTRLSEVLWKKESEQLPSAKVLLEEFEDDVDVFPVTTSEGVEQICWGMKKIAEPLRGKVVEIGLDATCACAVIPILSYADAPT